MAEVDISSYPKPSAPVPLIDQVQKLGALQQQQQQIESGGLTIEKQKLDLVNQRFGEMAKGFTSLIAKPDLNEDDVRKYVQNQVKLGYVPPEMAAQTISTLPPTQGLPGPQAAQVLKTALQQHLDHAQTTLDAINSHFGTPSSQQDSSNIYQGVTKSPMQGGGFVPATQTPIQLPPTTPTQNLNPASPGYGQGGYIGPAAPPGPRPFSANVAPPQAATDMVNDPSQGNLTGSRTTGPTGPTVAQGTEFNNRFSAAYGGRGFVPATVSPGAASAISEVATQSGKDYATDLRRATNFKADLYPAERALELVKELGPQGVGPGTEALNGIKSAMVTWLPNVDPKIIQGVSNFEEARKYLVQTARTSGNTGTNDQLAASFEANPSVKLSQATTENVLKSVIALKKLDAAQTLLFRQTGLQPDQYTKWRSANQNVLDPRAFGFDMMDNNAKKALVEQLKKDPKAYKKFEDSLTFAHNSELIEPPPGK
jgi:hypothetical protein